MPPFGEACSLQAPSNCGSSGGPLRHVIHAHCISGRQLLLIRLGALNSNTFMLTSCMHLQAYDVSRDSPLCTALREQVDLGMHKVQFGLLQGKPLQLVAAAEVDLQVKHACLSHFMPGN